MDANDGKVCVVIGGARGIGKAGVKALVENGIKVVVGDILEEIGQKTASEINKDEIDSIIFQRCDITNSDDIRALFERAKSLHGKVDIFVNFAGVCQEQQWEKMIDVNFKGVVRSTYIALDYMSIEHGGSGGVIVHTASIASLVPLKYIPTYTASKHAILGFIGAFGDESHFKQTEVRFNCFCPALVLTDLYTDSETFFVEEQEELFKTLTPVTPEQCAEAMMTLIKDETMNGEAIICAPREGNIVVDNTRTLDYAKLM